MMNIIVANKPNKIQAFFEGDFETQKNTLIFQESKTYEFDEEGGKRG
jgi:hypothetical protein